MARPNLATIHHKSVIILCRLGKGGGLLQQTRISQRFDISVEVAVVLETNSTGTFGLSGDIDLHSMRIQHRYDLHGPCHEGLSIAVLQVYQATTVEMRVCPGPGEKVSKGVSTADMLFDEVKRSRMHPNDAIDIIDFFFSLNR